MKKYILGMVALSTMTLLAISCEQQEDDFDNMTNGQNQMERTSSNLLLDDSMIPYQALLLNDIFHLKDYPTGLIVYIDEAGKYVHYVNNQSQSKADVKPDFASKDKEKFYEWVDARVAEGYAVTIIYDEKEGLYCGYLSPKPVTILG